MAWPPLIRATGPIEVEPMLGMHDGIRLLIASGPWGRQDMDGSRLLSVMWMVGTCGKTRCIHKRFCSRRLCPDSGCVCLRGEIPRYHREMENEFAWARRWSPLETKYHPASLNAPHGHPSKAAGRSIQARPKTQASKQRSSRMSKEHEYRLASNQR